MRSRSMLLGVLVLSEVCGGVLLATSAASAAPYYFNKGTFVMGGGFNTTVGETSPYLNSSGSFFIAGGRNINRRFALQAEYTHNWLAVDPSVIDRAQTDTTTIQDAHASMWSFTLNGVLRFNQDGDIVPWITAGGGYYKRNLLLTQYAWFYYPPIWDPWWGWIGGGWAPGEAIVGQRSDSGPGINVGAGVDFGIEGGASLFLEARYHHAVFDGVDMQVVPVTVGVRW